MFQDVWRVVSSIPSLLPVLATVDDGEFPIPIASKDIWLQGDGDLGARLERILRRALNNFPAAIALGADSPLITAQHLESALRGFETHDALLGRCHDGGFYLLGLRRCPSGLLASLPWSTPETANATRRRLEQRGFSIQEIASAFDVDTPGDLEHLAAALDLDHSLAPATRAWYAAH